MNHRASGSCLLVSAIFMVAAAACGGAHGGFSASSSDATAPAPGTPSEGGAAPTGPMGSGFGASDAAAADAGGAEGGASDACPEAATLVYVTGDDAKLYSFYPPTLAFTLIGKLSCLSNPTHMTVDRSGAAWVVSDNVLYKASTADASCSRAPRWQENLEYDDFALTFIGTTGAVDDTLYMLNDKGGLGTFDLATGNIQDVGFIGEPMSAGDMTSNGDGTLYFLEDSDTPTLMDLRPKDGSSIHQSDLDAEGGGAQALAFWGGSFYAFEDDIIYAYDPVAKTTKKVGKAPLTVTGAGQSTCVPKVPPPPPPPPPPPK